MPYPGQMLGDRYRLDDRIAAGGMGEVWHATDTVLGRDVAVKTLHAGRAGDSGFQSRFRHEARAMAVLHHPGVADVYDYGQTTDGAEAYIVMAHVRGQALSERIAEQGSLSPAETMSIVAQAGRALEAAHQAGIVHRDVKPGNLIIEPDGAVVLVDFGVARSAESPELTGAKEVVGTALYIAPEQVSKQQTGPGADIYALGALAYHCLTGRPPFAGKNPIAVAVRHLHDPPPPLPEDIPLPVRRLVETALAKDPDDRFPSAAAMADAADAAVAGVAGQETAILAAAGARPRTAGGIAPAAGGAVPARHTDRDAVTVPAPRTDAHPPSATGRLAESAGSGGTAVLPAAFPGGAAAAGKKGGTGRRRGMIIGLLVALAVAGAAIALALLLPGDHPGPDTPAASPAPVQSKPAVPVPKTGSTGRTGSTGGQDGRGTTTAPASADTDGAQPARTPTRATRNPTTPATPPATRPATANPTTAAPTTGATDPAPTSTGDVAGDSDQQGEGDR